MADSKAVKKSAMRLHAEIWKSQSPSEGSSASTAQVGKKGLWTQEWVEPPIPFDEFEMMAQENFCHRACCKRIAMDTIGLGFDIVPTEKAQNPDKAQQEELEAFFRRPNKDARRFMDFSLPLMMDYKKLANAAIEVVREEYVADDEGQPEEIEGAEGQALARKVSKAPEYLGKPIAMYRVPMRSVRVRRDKKLFKQEEDMEKAYFRPFGSDQNEEDENERQIYRDDAGGVFHELIHLKDDDGSHDYYGVPDMIAGKMAVKCALYVDWWNLTFFKRNMVPEVVVEVREVGDTELGETDLADTKELIEDYLRFEMMGQAHGVLYLQMPKGIDIKFNRISVDVKDASWRGWRLELQDMILLLHSMPPHRLGVVRGGKTTEGSLAQIETYKTSVIGPPQELLESVFKDIIDNGFGYTDWMLKLKAFDTTDKQAEATLAESLTNTAACSVDEIRKMQGKDPKPDDYLLTKIPFKVLEPLLGKWADGTMDGEVIERLITTGRFIKFTAATPGVPGGGVPEGATGMEGVETVEDYATGKLLPKGPEEELRQQYEKKLVEEYGYSKEQIAIEVPVQFGSKVGGMADIVVYKDSSKEDALILVEAAAKADKSNLDQAVSYANVIDSEYIVVFDGTKEIVMEKKEGKWERAEGVPKAEGAAV